ncbi:MAG: hypothetical protein JSV96_08435 [Candidatus Aminicenantes bacterium]|nr:MAG: hypothetical protein JSV96_08435 [Candidatus Aminicenantes bacterium]
MNKTKIEIKLSGLSDILFNRFIDHSKGKRPPEQLFYITEGNKLVLPNLNIDAFLFGENPGGCAKTFEGKKGKEYIRMGGGHVHISPNLIHFQDDKNKDMEFNGFEDDSRFWILEQGGRTKSGNLSIKQEPQPRPAMRLPWNLEFSIDLVKNGLIDGTKLYNWFCAGGLQIALGAYRPKFGRFEVVKWDEKEIEL